MSRNRKPSARRESKRRAGIAADLRSPQHGDLVIVTRLFPDGQVCRYRAYIVVELDGRTTLAPVKDRHAAQRAIDSNRVFIVAKTVPIPGHPYWFMISGIPVNLYRSVSSPLRRLMQMAPYSD